MNNKIIGKKIKELRQSNNWTQKELGEKVGLKPTSIADIENGRSSLSKLEIVDKFLVAFQITFDDLFSEIITKFSEKDLSDIDRKLELQMSQLNIKELSIVKEYLVNFEQYKNNRRMINSDVQQ